jgi:DNA polymerase V
MFEICVLVSILATLPERTPTLLMPTDSPPALVVTDAYRIQRDRPRPLAVFLSRVPAGFPSPADDYVEQRLDLNEHLIQREASTFFVRVAGRSMERAGIHDGDLLVVDRAVEPTDGAVVVAALDGELTVKRYRDRADGPALVPANEAHAPIPIEPGQELVVWGVVRHVIHEVS